MGSRPRSKWLFIFVGNNATGKTTVQRHLVKLLNGADYKRLPSNQAYEITHAHIMRKFRKVFIAGRSYQELRNSPNEYTTVRDYFRRKFGRAAADVDLAFMASHIDRADIELMIREAHYRFWNVCAIFFGNAISADPEVVTSISAELPWDERWYAENSHSDDEEVQQRQLGDIAGEIVQMLIERTRGW